MNMFRNLDEDEVADFKEFVRTNYPTITMGEDDNDIITVDFNISKLWHPVIQEECNRVKDDKMERIVKAIDNELQL